MTIDEAKRVTEIMAELKTGPQDLLALSAEHDAINKKLIEAVAKNSPDAMAHVSAAMQARATKFHATLDRHNDLMDEWMRLMSRGLT